MQMSHFGYELATIQTNQFHNFIHAQKIINKYIAKISTTSQIYNLILSLQLNFIYHVFINFIIFHYLLYSV